MMPFQVPLSFPKSLPAGLHPKKSQGFLSFQSRDEGEGVVEGESWQTWNLFLNSPLAGESSGVNGSDGLFNSPTR